MHTIGAQHFLGHLFEERVLDHIDVVGVCVSCLPTCLQPVPCVFSPIEFFVGEGCVDGNSPIRLILRQLFVGE